MKKMRKSILAALNVAVTVVEGLVAGLLLPV